MRQFSFRIESSNGFPVLDEGLFHENSPPCTALGKAARASRTAVKPSDDGELPPARAFGLGRCSRTHAATSCSRPLADISQMNSGTLWTIADGEVHGKPLEVGCAVLQGVPAIPTLL